MARSRSAAGLCVGLLFLAGRSSAQPPVGFEELYADTTLAASPPRGKASPARAEAAPVREWTVMAYINGKNNLSQYAVADINKMERVGSSDRVNVVVEAGTMYRPDLPGTPSLGRRSGPVYGETSVRRYLVVKGGDASRIESPVLEDLPGADMGDGEHLVEFVLWAKSRFPARRYALVVWNHGSGWRSYKPKKTPGSVVPLGVSYDDATSNHITTVELGRALAKVAPLDVYAHDACLMQMADVVYEIHESARVVVGSEEVEPAEGYAYDDFLRLLAARPEAAAEEVGGMIVDSYARSMAGNARGVTLSAVRSDAMPELQRLVSEWARLAMGLQDDFWLKFAQVNTRRFKDSDYRDLYHFIRMASDWSEDPALRRKGDEIMRHIDRRLVIRNAALTEKYKEAHGIAIYLPGGLFSRYDKTYDELAWAREGSWGEFLKRLRR